MKTVFQSASDTIHAFAQRTQTNGRSSNVFFERDKIYSYGYHFLMGEFYTNPFGQVYIIINDTNFSATTNKHLGMLKGATSQYKQFNLSDTDMYLAVRQIRNLLDKLKTARKKELYVNPIRAKFAAIQEYVEFSGQQNILQRDEYTEIFAAYKLVTSPEIEAYLKEQAEKIAKDKAKQKVRNLAYLAEQVKKFNAFEIQRIHVPNFEHEDYLRLSLTNAEVQTSQGVNVPLASAKFLYQAIKAGRNVVGQKIEGYQITAINGILRIGCHKINMDSVREVGEKLLSM